MAGKLALPVTNDKTGRVFFPSIGTTKSGARKCRLFDVGTHGGPIGGGTALFLKLVAKAEKARKSGSLMRIGV
jgi:hypothetical protein